MAGSGTEVVEVTWPKIVRLIGAHPGLAADTLRIDAAKRGVDAAGAVPNPTLEGNVGLGLTRAGDDTRFEWGLALSIPLGWIAQRRSRTEAAVAEVDVAVAESRSLRREVLLQLRTLFSNLVYAQARVASLEALDAENAALVRTVTRRVETGEVRPVEAIRVEIENEKVMSELAAARTALSARRADLALWLGVPSGKTLVAVADLTALPAAMDRDAALARVRTAHPATAVAAARTRVLDAEVDTERRARVPSFSITGFTAQELDRRAYGVGLAVDLPLWNWNTGRIAQAEANRAAGHQQAALTLLTLASTVIEAEAACRASIETATRLGGQVVPRSRKAAAMMEKTYELGEVSLLDVIDARRTLIESHRLYLNALAEAQLDCGRLDALVGEEPQ